MNQYPLVTVITPTYNRAPFLEETIKSVLAQNYRNIEYVVLDDGSNDDTAKVIKKFKNKIIFESHKNIGEVPTVNKGLSMAHGEIIGVVNSDDPLLPGSIGEVVKFMKENPEIIVAYSDWIVIDEKGRHTKKVITKDFDYEYMLRTHNCPLGASAFFKKSVLESLRGRDESFKYLSDFDFWLRAGLIGQFARIPKFLATSRVHSRQATFERRSFNMAIDHIRVINKIFSLSNFPSELKKIKPRVYEKACEAARISRGNKLYSKILISLISLWYSPIPYLKLFISFRLSKLRKMFSFSNYKVNN